MNSNNSLTYSYDSHGSSTGITALLQDIKSAGLKLKDLNSTDKLINNMTNKKKIKIGSQSGRKGSEPRKATNDKKR